MAKSPSHRFGQAIGLLLESVILPPLEKFCFEQGLYLDYQNRRRKARRGRKIRWIDHYGNAHDLDFVIERNGTDDIIGEPVAFIEAAWRRYTKHSRNKVQEIQGAILPLAEKYRWNNPFLGAVLAGEFTSGSLDQLESLGFTLLHLPYATLVDAFASQAIDIRFDETTPDAIFANAVQQISAADGKTMQAVVSHLVQANAEPISLFFTSLRKRLGRSIHRILVIPLYGRRNEFSTIVDALAFVDSHPIYEGSGEFYRYEIIVEFSNGDRLDASFRDKEKMRNFLMFVATQ